MARPRKNPASNTAVPQLPSMTVSGLAGWAEQLGEALGRGVARGINAGLASGGAFGGGATGGGFTQQQAQTGRRRGRPPKVQPGAPIPADRLCKVEGCPNAARSKGLCSKHYQAERRRLLDK